MYLKGHLCESPDVQWAVMRVAVKLHVLILPPKRGGASKESGNHSRVGADNQDGLGVAG